MQTVVSNNSSSQTAAAVNLPKPASATAAPVLSNSPAAPAPSPAAPSASAPSVATAPKPASPNLEEANWKSKLNGKKKMSQKQIPTILGMLVLMVSLVAGVLLFSDGTGVFAPRATPETTPKNIRVSNLTEKSFTISFFTDEETVAYVKYGEAANDLKKQASDDRDQLSGMVKSYRLHHITVRGIDPNKKYYYVLGTGSKATFDNNGEPYTIQTALKPSASSPNTQTLYGTVTAQAGGPAEGSVVFLYADGVGTLSSLVKSSGSWAISLANAFNAEGTAFPDLTDDSSINLKVQGIEPNLNTQLATTIAKAQPVPDLVLGANEAQAAEAADSTMETATENAVDREELLAMEPSATDTVIDPTIDPATGLSASESTSLSDPTASPSTAVTQGALGDLMTDSSETERTINLDELSEGQEATATTITSTQPKIKAVLPPNTTVKIEIHSDTAINQTVQTDADGNLELDVASLSQNLEPGEHTASYTYIDPTTGEEVSKTYTFTVAPDAVAANETYTPAPSQQIADSSLAETIPYGSGNPYSTSPTPSVSATPSATPTVSTRSAVVSTESGTYNSGSTATTLTLLIAAFFFVFTGVWSFLLAGEFKNET